jgi:hypothetical protein
MGGFISTVDIGPMERRPGMVVRGTDRRPQGPRRCPLPNGILLAPGADGTPRLVAAAHWDFGEASHISPAVL